MQYYIDMWKNYFNFSGRTSVKGYWMAYLFNVIIAFAIGVIVGILPDLAFLSGVYSIAIMIPGLSIAVRRLRDAGKSWGWLFISLVPLVGAIILIIMLCQPSVAAAQPAYTETYEY